MTSPDTDDDDDVVNPLTLNADRPVYDGGNLKVNITWSASSSSEGKEKNEVSVLSFEKKQKVTYVVVL